MLLEEIEEEKSIDNEEYRKKCEKFPGLKIR